MDLELDLIQLRYDAAKLSTADMLKTVDEQGFRATIAVGPLPASSP